jgi:hypothetical protein
MKRPVEQDMQRMIDSVQRVFTECAANVVARRDFWSYQCRADCAAAVRGS